MYWTYYGTSLTINMPFTGYELEHLLYIKIYNQINIFIYLLNISVSSMKYQFVSFSTFPLFPLLWNFFQILPILIGLIFHLFWIVLKFSISCIIWPKKKSSPGMWIAFFLYYIFWWKEIDNFNGVKFIKLFFCALHFVHLRNLFLPEDYNEITLHFLPIS